MDNRLRFFDRSARWRVVVLLAVVLLGSEVMLRAQELSLSGDDFARLDTFEGHSLQQADKVFAANQYRQAVAEYEAFLLEFPRSAATAYAIYRKGRGLQLDNKRFEAIRVFAEVLDYFPNDVRYAAAALFQIGQAHWDNGNVTEALRAWAEIADDVEYRLHALAAGAINRLADNLMGQDKPVEAVRYYAQVAVDFRHSNGDAARHAIPKVIAHYIRLQPDQAKLREFYEAVKTFEHHPGTPSDGNYWSRVIEQVRQHGAFGDDQEARRRHFRYWAAQMEGQHAAWDDFQIARIEFLRQGDGDSGKWMDRLDRQFAGHQKPDDFGRIVKWIQLYAAHKEKVQEYYAKLDFAKMGYDQIQGLMRIAFDHLNDADLARSVFSRIQLGAISDDQRYHLGRYLWHKDAELVERVTASMEDQVRGRMELLRFYHWRWWHHRHAHEPALALADEMTREPSTAAEAFWLKAEMLHRAARWDEAIAAYRASERLPAGPWRVVDCQLAAGRREQALDTLREIENFFKDDASQAALRIAVIYRDAGDRERAIAAFRGVLGKYPKSRESSTAHLELEKLGVTRIGGGMDAQ